MKGIMSVLFSAVFIFNGGALISQSGKIIGLEALSQMRKRQTFQKNQQSIKSKSDTDFRADLTVTTDIDVSVINLLNNTKSYTVLAGETKSIPLKKGLNTLKINPLDGGEGSRTESINAEENSSTQSLKLEIRKEREAKAAKRLEAEKATKAALIEAQTRLIAEIRKSMVFVKANSYFMGCPVQNPALSSYCNNTWTPSHPVAVGDFYLSRYEVTQKQWRIIMGESFSSDCDDCPAREVSYEKVQTFIKTLNAKSGLNFRLPTEAEWEYAAREGGKPILFGNGKNTADPNEINIGRVDPSFIASGVATGSKTTSSLAPVGSFQPNALGFYDMSGNVNEMCSDWYSESYYEKSPFINPQGPSIPDKEESMKVVIRGGSWNEGIKNAMVHDRRSIHVKQAYDFVGFRLARDL